MLFCYIDESGDSAPVLGPTVPTQPVLVILGIAVKQEVVAEVTRQFLSLKARFYPSCARPSAHFLDSVLFEVKGCDLRRDVRSKSRRERRHAIGVLDNVLRILEQYDIQLIGRILVKGIGVSISDRAVYTTYVQKISHCFQHLLEAKDATGIVIADSRAKYQNAWVSHSVFTLKYRAAGDPFPRMLEMPVFGHSDNHIGLQIADIVASGLLFPMATYTYCTGYVTNVHVDPAYKELRERFGARLRNLQHRYQQNGRWEGGVVVFDHHGHRSGVELFVP